MPRGRPRGSKNKSKVASVEQTRQWDNAYTMSPTLGEAIDSAIAEMPKAPLIKDKPFPEDWDKLNKVDKLKWLTANRK